jgi:anaerobic selenocysteine-containing dehydrogenase
VRAIFVYNSTPVAVAPDSSKVVQGFAREDLFVVVHDLFQTDTADYADLLLPATSQLEQFDLHHSYGHLYLQVNQPAIAPLGEALPNTELFRRLAARMGFDEPCFHDSDEAIARAALGRADPKLAGIDLDRLLNVPLRYAPFAQGAFPTRSGKCEFHSQAALARGEDALPAVILPRESAQTDAALARRYPLALISPPSRNFLNSSFANLPAFIAEAGAPALLIHPDDAAPRGIVDGDQVRAHNGRGAFLARAEVTDRARPGVVVAPSVWWRKLAPGGENANAVTGQALTDLGRAATFYDCLVEVAPAV